MTDKKGDLKVWWIPQVPMKPFCVAVHSAEEAAKLLAVLGAYDLFQLKHNVKPDYSNAGGLAVFDGTEWAEWEDDDGLGGIDDFAEALGEFCDFSPLPRRAAS